MGTQELPEIYRMALEAKAARGMPAPPLHEHRAMTAEELRQYQREAGEALAVAKAKNDQIVAEIRGDLRYTTIPQEES